MAVYRVAWTQTSTYKKVQDGFYKSVKDKSRKMKNVDNIITY
jgi:hypothetical protein